MSRRIVWFVTAWGLSCFRAVASGRRIHRLPIHTHSSRSRSTQVTPNNESDMLVVVEEDPIMSRLPLFQAPGTHYVTLSFGCDEEFAQPISLIVDTGSGATAFPCSRCDGCDANHLGSLYLETNASSCYRPALCEPHHRGGARSDQCAIGHCYRPSSRRKSNHRHRELMAESYCRITRRYNEGSSWVASEATDLVRLPSGVYETVALNLTFGCQSSIRGLFTSQLADGIMGMSRYSKSFWRQAYDQHLIDHRAFGLCFRQLHQADGDTSTPAGVLTLGGADDSLNDTPMIYASMHAVDDYYSVHVEGIHLRMHGGGSVNPDRQSHYNLRYETVDLHSHSSHRAPFIVDSGTTVTYLHEDLEYPFSDAWRALTGRHYSPYREYAYDRDELNDYLPTILFQLSPWRREENDLRAPWIVSSLDRYNRGSILVAMPPTQYMRFMEDDNVWVSRIFFTSDSKQTLGSNFLQGKNVLFDMDNERIGFAESSCSVNHSAVKEFGLGVAIKKKSVGKKLHDAASFMRNETSCNMFCRVVTAVLISLAILACLFLCKHDHTSATDDGERTGTGADAESRPLLGAAENRANGHQRRYL